MTDDSDRLPLDSPRWGQLWTRMGPGAYPVPQALRALGDAPSDLELFQELWPEICSEETTYDVAFAAAPYLVDFAARLGSPEADEYLIVAGLIATYAAEVPSDLEPAFRAAMRRGLDLALERLKVCRTNSELRYLLGSVAAMRGADGPRCHPAGPRRDPGTVLVVRHRRTSRGAAGSHRTGPSVLNIGVLCP